MPAVVESRAQLGRLPLRHVHRGEVGGVVLDREHAELVEVGDAGQGAPVVAASASAGSVLRSWAMSSAACTSPRGSCARSPPVPRTMHTALSFFFSHDRAAAVLGRHVAVVAVDGGEADEILPATPGPYTLMRWPTEPVLRLQRLLRLPGVLALEVRRVADLHHPVVDVEVGQLLGLSLDDDGVVAGELQRGAEESVGIGGGGAVRHGAPR